MRFDPDGYPGPRPRGPVLVRGGRTHPLVLDGEAARPWRRPAGGPVPDPAELRLCVAYGANASPPRLMDKGLDRRGAVLLPARMTGWVPVFEARRTGYGAVPLTLVPAGSPAFAAPSWVLGVHVGDLDVLDRSEGRFPDGGRAGGDDERTAPAGSYVLAPIGPVAVGERFLLPRALAYQPGPGTRLLPGPGGWLTWPEHDQAEARARLDTGPSGRPAPVTEAVEVGTWPPTPLEDLPVFVYGTLRPEGSAFSLVEDLVEVVGPASIPGRLYAPSSADPGSGFPAVDLEADGQVHGVLLRPRSSVAAAALVSRVDRYEGTPAPFRRRAVPVTREDEGVGWAIAYGWAAGVPPGSWRPDGRW